jgi:hypothetical protein
VPGFLELGGMLVRSSYIGRLSVWITDTGMFHVLHRFG